VLRASAIRRVGSSSAVAFAGERGCGKSTLAYAIGSRPGWGQLADDTLAFDLTGPFTPLLPMPDRVRLQPPASTRLASPPGDLVWPDPPPRLEAIYLLHPSEARASRAEIRPVSLNEAYRTLLEGAKRLAIPDASRHRELAEAVRELATNLRVFRLTYSKNVSQLRSLTNGVSQHVLSVVGRAEAARERELFATPAGAVTVTSRPAPAPSGSAL
jgi:hypothetical protein